MGQGVEPAWLAGRGKALPWHEQAPAATMRACEYAVAATREGRHHGARAQANTCLGARAQNVLATSRAGWLAPAMRGNRARRPGHARATPPTTSWAPVRRQ